MATDGAGQKQQLSDYALTATRRLNKATDYTTDDRLLSVPQFAVPLGVTQACVRRWLLERRITFTKIGRLVRIPASEVDRLIAEGLHPAKPRRAQ
ncbi:MAG: helix-turn-helix domain-containing protein [Terriglobia bacterium]|jgi:excisionase family DNA binding protein